VGATAATFGVSDTGKATYRIPIDSPPGREGVEPHLALTYGGTQHNGVLGVGWYLEGLSSISRCSHRFAEEGYTAPPGDATSDRFCLDGTHLVAFDEDAYGEDGTTYSPEFDAKTRAISYGNSGGGPATFKVWHENGLIYTYGGTDSSSVYSNVDTGLKRQWALSRVEDHLGNYMTVDYLNVGPASDNTSALPDRGTREIVPFRISYTGFDGPGGPALEPNRSVVLSRSLTARPDPTSGYTYGAHTTIRGARIASITTVAGGTEVRHYRLTYGDEIGQPAQNGDSRIATITECVHSDCKSPTQFEYYDSANTPFAAPVDAGVSLPASVTRNADENGNHTPTTTGTNFVGVDDSDGDGRDDIVYQWNSLVQVRDHEFLTPQAHYEVLSPRWGFLRGQVAPAGHLLDDGGLALSAYGGVEPLGCDGSDTQSDVVPVEVNSRSLVDWNLDGTGDLLDFRHPGPGSVEVLYYQPETLSYALRPINSDPRPSCDEPGGIQGNEGFAIGDADGDGLPDIIGCSVDHTRIVERLAGTPSLSGNSVSSTLTFCTSTWADMDGDGIAEPVKRTPDNTGVITAKLRADLGTTTESTFTLQLGLPRFDLNGDGLDDVIASEVPAHTTTPVVHIWLNTGKGFTEVAAGNVAFEPRLVDFAVGADLDHDGLTEVIIPAAATVPTSGLMSDANVWNVFGYTPDGLVLRASIDTGAFPATHPTSTFTPDYSNRILGDFDGDGNLDFAVTGAHDDAHRQPVRVLPGQSGADNLLKSVTDGLGKRIDITYSNSVYKPGSNCSPLRCETHPPNLLVSSYTMSQTLGVGTLGTKVERTYDYGYEDARTDLQNHRYLGFSKRTISERAGLTSLRDTEIHLDNSTSAVVPAYPFAGHRTLVRVTDEDTVPPLGPALSGDSLLSSRVTETEYDWIPSVGAAATVTAQLNVRETRVIDRTRLSFGDPVDHPVLTVHEVYDYDDQFGIDLFDNVTHITRTETTASGLATSEIGITYRTDGNFLNDWLISLPQTKTVTDTVVQGGQTQQQTRVTTYDHYPYGLLKQTIREPNDPYYRLQTDIIRDQYGNAQTLTDSSVDSTAGPARARGKSFVYDNDQIYPVTVTNALGQVSYLDFDRRFGKPTLFADPNGIATQWAYDVFGREAVSETPATDTSIT
jgi:Salmonella virulence plasmid 65kDa B protein/FG-GAP-like repeat/Insecticide toxin TcdB middle/N-terminal region